MALIPAVGLLVGLDDGRLRLSRWSGSAEREAAVEYVPALSEAAIVTIAPGSGEGSVCTSAADGVVRIYARRHEAQPQGQGEGRWPHRDSDGGG